MSPALVGPLVHVAHWRRELAQGQLCTANVVAYSCPQATRTNKSRCCCAAAVSKLWALDGGKAATEHDTVTNRTEVGTKHHTTKSTMGRPRPPLRRQLMASAAVCCSLLLLRHGGGGALAQRSGGGDDDDDSNRRNGNTVSPSGAPASASATSSNGDDDGNNRRNGITPSPSVAATSSNGDEDDSNRRDGITPSPSGSASLSNGDDDGSNGRNGGITPNPTGAPAPLGGDDDTSTQYPNCPGYTSHIRDGYCDSDLNVAACGWDGGERTRISCLLSTPGYFCCTPVLKSMCVHTYLFTHVRFFD